MRHLLNDLQGASPHSESFVFLDRVLLLWEWGVTLLRVEGSWRRRGALEVNGAAREPGELRSAAEVIGRCVLLV